MIAEKKEFDWLAGRFRTGAINRREFLGRSAALGAVAGFSPLLSAKSVLAATPVRGGEMILGSRHGATSDSLDPGLLTNGLQWTLGFARGATLTEIGADGSAQPSLASEWEASADARTWTIRLRDGVEFHSGKTLTPADVIASLDHHRSADSKSFVKPFAEQIAEMKADGNNVVIVLKGSNADFPSYLGIPGFLILPSEEGRIDPVTHDGLGGYVLESYEPGVRATLNRFPNFWRDDRAFVDRVELLTIADAAARNNAVMTGAVHAIDHADPKTVDLLARADGIVIDEVAGPLHYTFPMLTKTPPFDDVNVRRAMKHAIDREEMLAKILRGHGTIGNDHPIGPSYPYHAGDLEQIAYDPDKARHYLKKAGLDGLNVELSAADAAFEGAVDAAQLFQASAAKAGVTIDLRREPDDGYWSDVWIKKPFVACYWGGYTTESQMFSTGYAPGAAWNDTQWDDEHFDKLRLEAQAELDPAKRRVLYSEMQRILRDDGGAIVPFFANFVMARSERLQHGELASDNTFDGQRIAERWWMT